MKVNYMIIGYDCAQELKAFLKFGISIRDERVLSRIVHWSRIVEGSNAIRARPILVQDERGSLPKLSWPIDYPMTFREKFFRPSALSLSSGCVTLRNSEQAPQPFLSRVRAGAGPGPIFQSMIRRRRATLLPPCSKNRWCTYGPLFRPQPRPCDWRATRERARRRSRLNEWASEVYLDPVSRERDNTIAFYSNEQNIARMKSRCFNLFDRAQKINWFSV